MKHTSIKMDCPVEFINLTPLNPLISKCQIKVCYVGEDPNRNKSIITKEVAKNLANSIPGSPIVGFYNESTEDFEEHNKIIDISNGEFKIKDTTVPYGFVDINAKCWFQKFSDDGVEHEYLMTEGFLWTGQYPECQRIIDKGNNQSMELDQDTINATWTKDDNGKPQFFIINEAVMSKLCILGEDFEPCFEGSQITNVQFSFGDDFKTKLYSMMDELKELLNEGGAPRMFNRYAVEIGDALWSALYKYLRENFVDPEDDWCSVYGIEGIYEEKNQKFAILRHTKDLKYYRLNFVLNDQGEFIPSDQLIEVTKTYIPAEEPQFNIEAVNAYINEYKSMAEEKQQEDENSNENEGKEDSSNSDKIENKTDEDLNFSNNDNEESQEADEEEKMSEYSIEEVEEIKKNYAALQDDFSELNTKFELLTSEKETLEAELVELRSFKNDVERVQKEEMINSFYMLSEEDKADVIENINSYSLEDIEAKLSVICFRNKINFSIDEEGKNDDAGSVVFNIDDNNEDDSVPAWIKAVVNTARNM